jgi:hypothetical protein
MGVGLQSGERAVGDASQEQPRQGKTDFVNIYVQFLTNTYNTYIHIVYTYLYYYIHGPSVVAQYKIYIYI